MSGPDNIHLIESCGDARRAAFGNRDARVAVGLALEDVGVEIVELNFGVGGHNLRARLAHVHLAQHAAADTQVGARAITARRFDYKHGLREFHIFNLAIGKLDCAGVDVGGRALHAPVANREPHAGDVDAADLRARRAGGANLHVFNNHTRHAVATDDVDVVGSDAVDLRARSDDRSGLDSARRWRS